MPEQRLDGMRVAILVSDDFEESEMSEPRRALAAAGASATLIASKAGEVHAMRHAQRAGTFPVDMTLDKAKPEDFDAVMLPGGALNADALRVQPAAQRFVRAMQDEGKPFAVICHAPWLLVSAGLARGRTLTSYHTIQDDIRNAGASWVDQEVCRDDNWVTSRSPKDLPAFNAAMIGLFAERRGAAGSGRHNGVAARSTSDR